MSKRGVIAIAISALLMHKELKVPYKNRQLIVTNPPRKQQTIIKKAVKPKGKNYTSKMKVKPNSVRKDFNQRRR